MRVDEGLFLFAVDVSHTTKLFLFRNLQNITHCEHIISMIVVLFICKVYS